MKKTILRFLVFTLVSFGAAASDYVPKLHTTPSVRQQGFGGFYTTDVYNFYGIFANPATLALKKEHALFPSIDLNLAGPLKDVKNIVKSLSDGDTTLLSKIIEKNNGLQFGMNVSPLLSFGKISPIGLGWAFNTQVFMNASVPSVALSDVNLGLESLFRLGFGFRLINTDNHFLGVGATGKAFAQFAASNTGNIIDFIQKIKNDFSSIPAYFSIGYGIDLGAYYSLCNRLDIGFTWHDALTFAHVTESTIGDLKFEFGKAQKLDSKVSCGVAYRFPVDWSNGIITSFKVMAEYRDITNLFGDQIRNPVLDFACGTELVVGSFVSVRAGINDMYPAFGVGLAMKNFKLDFSVYGSELGLEPGSTPCLNSSIFIGFTY